MPFRSGRMPLATGLLLLLTLPACDVPTTLRAQQATPVIPFVPGDATTWPLWPTDGGWLVGGSGFRSDHGSPWPIGPGLGLGSLLQPSRLSGSWLGLPGPWPPAPIQVVPTPYPVWGLSGGDQGRGLPSLRPSPGPSPFPSSMPGGGPTSEDEPEGAARLPEVKGPTPFPVLVGRTKMGPTRAPAPSPAPWPSPPFYLSPWGPVRLQPGPLPEPSTPAVWRGFPPADGTPVADAPTRSFIRRQGDYGEIVLFDPVTRTLLRPPGVTAFGDAVGISGGGPTIFIALPPDQPDNLRLIDVLTGSYDPLPEIAGTGIEHSSSAQYRFIAYTSLEPEGRQVHLFDRRQRLVDRLQRLNAGRQTFDAGIDGPGRWIAYVTPRADHTAVEIYDTTTGLVDPLPALEGMGNLIQPNFSADGRWLAFLADGSGRFQARIYDRVSGAIDRLPEVNREGPMRDVSLSADGLMLQVNVFRSGHWQAIQYWRPTGFIDWLPEVNQTDWDVAF